VNWGAHIFVRKYGTDDRVVWNRRFEHPGEATGIAVDNTGVYVVGYESGLAFAARLDHAGRPVWARSLAADMRYVNAIAVHPNGIYAAGAGYTSDHGVGAILKLDRDGHQLWPAPAVFSTDMFGLGVNSIAVVRFASMPTMAACSGTATW
jgi:hypothetical protein